METSNIKTGEIPKQTYDPDFTRQTQIKQTKRDSMGEIMSEIILK